MTLQREIECVCVFLPHSPHFHSSQHLLLCPCLVTEHWPVTAGVSGGESRHRWIRLSPFCFIILLLPRHEGQKKNPQRSEFGHILVCTWSWGLRAPPLRADQLKLTARLKIADCATSKPWNQAAAPCMGILWSSKKWKKLREIPRMNQTSVTGFHAKAWNSVSSTPNHSCLQENYCKCSWFIWYHVSSSETEVAKKAHCAVFAFAWISLFVC